MTDEDRKRYWAELRGLVKQYRLLHPGGRSITGDILCQTVDAYLDDEEAEGA